MMRILALDLGTHLGWALSSPESSGTLHLQTPAQRRFEGSGMKWLRLRKFLDEVGAVDLVVLEEVRRHAGTDAAHAYGGALAVVTAWCEQHKIPHTSFAVSAIKRHATGKGNANKDAMIKAAAERGWIVEDDNHADALWILDLSKQEHGVAEEKAQK
jgi:hypothetical protein